MEWITIKTRVEAGLQTTWDLWTDPHHIIHWNTASDDWHTTKAENDLRVGGRFLSRMEAKDGSFGFDFSGVYLEVIPLDKIVYSLDDGRTVNIDFKWNKSSTEITIDFEAEMENPIEMQQQGWQAILDSFKAYAEKIS